MVVIVPPGFQIRAGMSAAGKDRLVQQLGAQARIETLDGPVLVWLAWSDVAPCNPVLLRPAQDRHASQLVAVIAEGGVGSLHAL